MKSNLIGMAMVAAVVACAPVGDNVARDTGGVVLGETDWKALALRDSRLQLTGAIDLVGSVKHASLPDRYLEEWKLERNGQLTYEQVHATVGGFKPATASKDTFARSLRRGLDAYGIAVTAADIQNHGRLNYVLLDIGDARCIFFKQVYGRPAENLVAGDRIISGRLCEAADDPNADTITDSAFYFLDQLQQNSRKVFRLGDLAPKQRPARVEAEA